MLAKRNGDGLGAVGGADLVEDDANVLLDARLGDVETGGDLFGRKTVDDHPQDLALFVGERFLQELYQTYRVFDEAGQDMVVSKVLKLED